MKGFIFRVFSVGLSTGTTIANAERHDWLNASLCAASLLLSVIACYYLKPSPEFWQERT